MKQMLKRSITSMLVLVVLLSCTVVYGAISENYSFYLSVGHTAYTEDGKQKETRNGYAVVEQLSPTYPNGVYVTYTATNNSGFKKSASEIIYSANTKTLSYEGYNVQPGDVLKLGAYNNPEKNQGRPISFSGIWTP